MPAVAVDTHAIVWYLSADLQLSARAAGVLDAATEAGEFIHVPSICLVELTYLVEKGRLPVAARDLLIRAWMTRQLHVCWPHSTEPLPTHSKP